MPRNVLERRQAERDIGLRKATFTKLTITRAENGGFLTFFAFEDYAVHLFLRKTSSRRSRASRYSVGR
jgi:hypothetical protein